MLGSVQRSRILPDPIEGPSARHGQSPPEGRLANVAHRDLWARHPGIFGWSTVVGGRRRPVCRIGRDWSVDKGGCRDPIRRFPDSRRLSREPRRNARPSCRQVSRSHRPSVWRSVSAAVLSSRAMEIQVSYWALLKRSIVRRWSSDSSPWRRMS